MDLSSYVEGDEPALSEREMKLAFEKIYISKSPGIDLVEGELAKSLYGYFPEFFGLLYNQCFLKGVFPDEWKVAMLKIIPRPGLRDMTMVSSYRPISLLSVLGKTLERVIANRLTSFQRRNSRISEKQHGFCYIYCIYVLIYRHESLHDKELHHSNTLLSLQWVRPYS